MSYKLTLTKGDRDAIDWIGDRYSGAPAIRTAFQHSPFTDLDIEWDDEGTVTFDVPEHFAWAIQQAAEEDMAGGYSAWPCFAPELRDKLNAFLDSIV